MKKSNFENKRKEVENWQLYALREKRMGKLLFSDSKIKEKSAKNDASGFQTLRIKQKDGVNFKNFNIHRLSLSNEKFSKLPYLKSPIRNGKN